MSGYLMHNAHSSYLLLQRQKLRPYLSNFGTDNNERVDSICHFWSSKGLKLEVLSTSSWDRNYIACCCFNKESAANPYPFFSYLSEINMCRDSSYHCINDASSLVSNGDSKSKYLLNATKFQHNQISNLST